MSQIINVHGTNLQVRVGKDIPFGADKVAVTNNLGEVLAKFTPFPEKGIEGIYPWTWYGQPVVGNNSVIKIDSKRDVPQSYYYNVETQKKVCPTELYK